MSASKTLPTSDEVDRRLRIVAELRNLCLSLGRAKRIVSSPEGMDGKIRPCDPVDDREPLRRK